MTENYQDKALELKRNYLRKWRKKHPEKVREYNRTYWERKAMQAEQEDGEHE